MKKSFVLFLIFLISCSGVKESKIRDLIKPVNLENNNEKEIVIGDIFYSPNYNIKLKTNPHLNVTFNDSTGKLVLSAKDNFRGITLLKFELDNQEYAIPVNIYSKPMHKFSYKSEKKIKSVSVFGNFNDWNRYNLMMKDEDGDGVYETKVALDPGLYEYKFFVNGKTEILDPENKNKKSNGLGSFNSVLEIKDNDPENLFVHKLESKDSEISFYVETSKKKVDFIALIDNFDATPFIKTSNKTVSVDLKELKVKNPKTFRLAAYSGKKISNYQIVPLYKGKPAKGEKFSWLDGVIYSLLIDRFYNGDKSNDNPVIHPKLSKKANYNGGDLKGLKIKIEEGYFDSLGINTLWISPVYDNPNEAYQEYPAPHRWYSGYHGYWPISPNKVEEHFGDMELLKEVINTAHKHNMKVLLDFVSNHVHKDHPYYKEHPEWFGKLELPDGRLNLRFWDEFRLTTWFEPYLPSFDYLNSKEALETMTDNALWWLNETGADGFRHDAVKHVPNKFWRLLTKKLKEKIEVPLNKEVYQVGETFGSDELVSSYVNNGQLSAQFNFNLYNVAQTAFIDPEASFDILDKALKQSFKFYGELNVMANIMDSHDKNRYMAYADGDLDLSQWSAIEEGWNNPPKVDNPSSYDKCELYFAYEMTIPGIPVIYYGSEFGMTGASDPDNRRMMRFGDELNSFEKSMLQDVRKLVKLRKQHPALRYGDLYTIKADKNIFAYIRSDFNERILVVINKSEHLVETKLNIPEEYKVSTLQNLINNEEIKSDEVLKLDGLSWNIYQIK